ncbi:hypothetical protein [Paraburkholderia unamae]|uniref:hypothetical protein n=1 Tax=Paraburkholderia unamae TaxID=219649 RepID=UPI0021AC5221|nr:hypothetical protein [Paraburkholderia unamae]
MPMSNVSPDSYDPIIPMRGFATDQVDIGETTADPFCGFNDARKNDFRRCLSAHSTGGLVARTFLRRSGQTAEPGGLRERVLKYFAYATLRNGIHIGANKQECEVSFALSRTFVEKASDGFVHEVLQTHCEGASRAGGERYAKAGSAVVERHWRNERRAAPRVACRAAARSRSAYGRLAGTRQDQESERGDAQQGAKGAVGSGAPRKAAL